MKNVEERRASNRSIWHVKWLDTAILNDCIPRCVCLCFYMKWCKMNNIHCLFVYKYFLQLFAHHVTNARQSKHISTHSLAWKQRHFSYNTNGEDNKKARTQQREENKIAAAEKNSTEQINKQKCRFGVCVVCWREYTRREQTIKKIIDANYFLLL